MWKYSLKYSNKNHIFNKCTKRDWCEHWACFSGVPAIFRGGGGVTRRNYIKIGFEKKKQKYSKKPCPLTCFINPQYIIYYIHYTHLTLWQIFGRIITSRKLGTRVLYDIYHFFLRCPLTLAIWGLRSSKIISRVIVFFYMFCYCVHVFGRSFANHNNTLYIII